MSWDEVWLRFIEVKQNTLPPSTLKLDRAGLSETLVSKTGTHQPLAPFRPPDAVPCVTPNTFEPAAVLNFVTSPF
jgi:hypothetical protein